MKTAFKSASKLPLLVASALALLSGSGVVAASLWPADGSAVHGMFADHKASRAGDILTIVVGESTTAQNSQSKKSTRTAGVNDAVGQFLFSTSASKLGTHKGELPATTLSGNASYSGGGEASNTQSVVGNTSVLVTDVLPNGNLVISGVRMITFSSETLYVVLSGVVRPDDITSSNTIASANIAEARVEFVNDGNLTDAQKRGWLTKVYEKLRPF